MLCAGGNYQTSLAFTSWHQTSRNYQDTLANRLLSAEEILDKTERFAMTTYQSILLTQHHNCFSWTYGIDFELVSPYSSLKSNRKLMEYSKKEN